MVFHMIDPQCLWDSWTVNLLYTKINNIQCSMIEKRGEAGEKDKEFWQSYNNLFQKRCISKNGQQTNP